MGDLEVDTRVTGGGGHYTADLSAAWEIWGPCGGYVAAVLLRAAGAHSDFPRPVSLAVQFVAMGLSTQEKLDTGTLDEVLTVHQYGVAMTILNASMRIMRISHIDMQRVLYSLTRDFDAMCRTAMRTPLEQMSNYAPMTDILAASHVKAHVRLFMG